MNDLRIVGIEDLGIKKMFDGYSTKEIEMILDLFGEELEESFGLDIYTIADIAHERIPDTTKKIDVDIAFGDIMLMVEEGMTMNEILNNDFDY